MSFYGNLKNLTSLGSSVPNLSRAIGDVGEVAQEGEEGLKEFEKVLGNFVGPENIHRAEEVLVGLPSVAIKMAEQLFEGMEKVLGVGHTGSASTPPRAPTFKP